MPAAHPFFPFRIASGGAQPSGLRVGLGWSWMDSPSSTAKHITTSARRVKGEAEIWWELRPDATGGRGCIPQKFYPDCLQPTHCLYIEQAPLLWTPSPPSEAHAPSQQYYPLLSLNRWDLVSKIKDYIEITWVFASLSNICGFCPFLSVLPLMDLTPLVF